MSDVLSKHQDNWPRRRIDKLGFYEVDGVRHHIGLEIETHGPDLVILALEAHAFSRNEQLRASTRRRQERKFDEIQSILSELGRLELHSQVYSHMAWTFEADSMKPIIALPMMTIQNPSIPFMEISGVRMKRRTGDGLSTVTLDLREDRSLTVTMMYPVPGLQISEEVMSQTIQMGSRTIGDFVISLESQPQ